jgi:hypothetical protein
MNPIVTLAAAATGDCDGTRYQLTSVPRLWAPLLGVRLARIMSDLPSWQLLTHARTGLPHWVAEVVATFGLLTVI